MTMRLDVVTNDAGDLVRREHARDLGAGVVVALYRLMKLVQVHDLGNQAFQRQLDATLDLVRDYGLRAGSHVNVLFAGRAVFVSGQLLKGARSTYESARELAAIFEACGSAEITLQRELTREDLFAFAEAFSAAVRTGRLRSFRSPSPRIQLRPVNAAARLRGLDVEKLEIEARIVRTYASAVVVMRRFFEDLEAGRYLLPRRIKRIAQGLVDLSGGGTPAYLGVTEVRNANHDVAGRAVNGAILAVAMAREVTEDRVTLAQIAMAALMHDVARPRAAARAAAAGPALTGVAARLGEDAEDKLAAGAAAVLTALGRLNEPTILRTVVAYEALAVRRTRSVGPLYRGARGPTLHARIVAVARLYNDRMTPEPGLPPVAAEAAIAQMLVEQDDPADRTVLRMLVAALRLLPPGTVVQLASGEVAEVLRGERRGQTARMRLVMNEHGGVVDGPEVVVPERGPRMPVRVLSIDGWTRSVVREVPRPALDDSFAGPLPGDSEPPPSALDVLSALEGRSAPPSVAPSSRSPSVPAPARGATDTAAPARGATDTAAPPRGATDTAAPPIGGAPPVAARGPRVRIVPRPGGPAASRPSATPSAEHRGPSPSAAEHRAPSPSNPDHGGSAPSVAEHRGPSPSVAEHRGPSPSSPELRRPSPSSPDVRSPAAPDVAPPRNDSWSAPSTSGVVTSEAAMRASRPSLDTVEPPSSGPPSFRAPLATSPGDVGDAFERHFKPPDDEPAERTMYQPGVREAPSAPPRPPAVDAHAIPEASARGTLSQTPLLHMLVYMLDRGLSGSVVFFEADGSEDTVYFDRGTPMKVRTAQAIALLGDELVRLGFISADTARRAADGAQRLGLLLGEWLVGYDHITREQLDEALRGQISRKITTLANLSSDAQFAFYKDIDLLEGWGGGDFLPTDALSLVLACARTWHDRARMHATLGRLGAQPLALHRDAVAHALEMTHEERQVLDALVLQPRSLADLHAARVADEETVSALVYTLAVTRQLDLPGQKGGPMAPVPRDDEAGVRLSFYGDRPSQVMVPSMDVPPPAAVGIAIPSEDAPSDEDDEEARRAERALKAMTDLRLAESAVERGDLRAAEDLARSAAAAHPDRPEYAAYLTWVRAMGDTAQLGDHIATLTALLAKEPRCERALLYRGRLFKRAGRPAQALGDFDLLLAVNPNHREAQSEERLLRAGRRR